MDQGSLLTIDVLLTDPADIEGGVLQTLEADDQLRGHAWERGDALVFLSHKYHTLCRKQGLCGQLAHVADWPRLAEARGSLRRALALIYASESQLVEACATLFST